jgi:hypothetical protein
MARTVNGLTVDSTTAIENYEIDKKISSIMSGKASLKEKIESK